jgi:hypothetical protein
VLLNIVEGRKSEKRLERGPQFGFKRPHPGRGIAMADDAGKLYEPTGRTWKQPPSAIEATPANDTHQ